MNLGHRLTLLSILVLLGAGTATAAPPTLNVTPNTVDRTGNQSIAANVDHNASLTFSNLDAQRPIYNVTLPEKPYLSYSDNQFDLNPSQSRNITATINTPAPTTINDQFTWSQDNDSERDPVQYYYNETSGNQSQITFNAEHFPILEFNIDSYWRNTSVETTALTTEFNLSLDETDSSAFELRNTGPANAHNISLSGENVSFQPNTGFNLTQGDDRVISFSVVIPKPDQNATAATNQTYNRTITVSGDNFPDTQFAVSIFVPYHDYSSTEQDNESLAPLLEEFKEYCDRTGNCSRIREVEYRNRTVYRNKTFLNQANLTNDTLAALRDLADNELEDDKATRQRVDLLKNAMQTDIESLNRSMRAMMREAINNSQQAKQLAEEAKQETEEEQRLERQKSRQASHQTTIFILIFLVAALLIGGGIAAYKIHQRRTDPRLIKQ